MGDVRNILPSSWSSSSSLDAWIKQSPFLCLMRRNFCALKGVLRLEKISPQNPRFKPWMLWGGYFSYFSQRIAQIGTQASTGVFACDDHTWQRKSWKAMGAIKSSSLSPGSSLDAWMNQCPFLCLMRCKFCTLKKETDRVFLVLEILNYEQ